eukprot:CAMPEP_0174250500 /NCGR_PEP_ID=MMETSP0439-20130205/654_1 /TAXON_ID=0 /ORGANISM="Stereomyxa ramosa, Strain Chinc5" /LENGTH=568 /DNA_ID=CAMNT_0015330591 /DNA_START=89 /DNA_END=1795 /DNA_ORIENTATION=+
MSLENLFIAEENVKKTHFLGGGSYGQVWQGECFNKPIAIKIVGTDKVENLTDEEFEELKHEVLLMTQSLHGNIILAMGMCTMEGKVGIIMELLDGDLEDLLVGPRSAGRKMSLFQRLLLAKDAALGMDWLHSHTPTIIHRDLKLQNLMYKKIGKNYIVKVADFGLAVVKPDHKKHMTSDGEAGTPLTMAPEVMMNKPFHQKADVYSFGVCLWQIVMCKQPYSGYDQYDDFVKAVCEDNIRPPVKKITLAPLRELIEKCWHPNPSRRPSFSRINKKLNNILILAAIADPQGQIFWKKYFPKTWKVEWVTNKKRVENPDAESSSSDTETKDSKHLVFASALYDWLGIDINNLSEESKRSDDLLCDSSDSEYSDSSDEDELQNGQDKKKKIEDNITIKCLQALLVVDEVVDIEHFGKFLKYYGPMEPKNRANMDEDEINHLVSQDVRFQIPLLERITDLLSQKWFHGDISEQDARRILQDKKSGSFVIRTSGEVGYFAITRRSDKGKYLSTRLRQTNKGFKVADSKNRWYPTLTDLVNNLIKKFKFKACGGSRFDELFQDEENSGGYEILM